MWMRKLAGTITCNWYGERNVNECEHNAGTLAIGQNIAQMNCLNVKLLHWNRQNKRDYGVDAIRLTGKMCDWTSVTIYQANGWRNTTPTVDQMKFGGNSTWSQDNQVLYARRLPQFIIKLDDGTSTSRLWLRQCVCTILRMVVSTFAVIACTQAILCGGLQIFGWVESTPSTKHRQTSQAN